MAPTDISTWSANTFRRDTYSNADFDRQMSLSIGAWVGIVVGIVLIKIGIVVAICYCCKRRERRIAQSRVNNALYNTPGYKRSISPEELSKEDTGYYPPSSSDTDTHKTGFLHKSTPEHVDQYATAPPPAHMPDYSHSAGADIGLMNNTGAGHTGPTHYTPSGGFS